MQGLNSWVLDFYQLLVGPDESSSYWCTGTQYVSIYISQIDGNRIYLNSYHWHFSNTLCNILIVLSSHQKRVTTVFFALIL